MALPSKVRIVEVGPRDGLQNEKHDVPTALKLELIKRLGATGLKSIESAAFVSPKWVPQMADSATLFPAIEKLPDVAYPVLVPNLKGFEAAVAAGAREVAVFAAASETFSKKNTNCSIAESVERFRPILEAARGSEVKVRGYVSCALGCPFEGEVSPMTVAAVSKSLFDMGCYEIGLADTIGIGTPDKVKQVIESVARNIPLKKIAGHYHDTYGMAITNVYASLQMGVSVFDSSVAGLGGCPYAPGATGNVATEDLVWLLKGLGLECGVDLDALVDTGVWISKKLKRHNCSRVTQAILAARAAATGKETVAADVRAESDPVQMSCV